MEKLPELRVLGGASLMLLLTSLPSCVPTDPHSVARPDLVKTSHLYLHLEADFERKIFSGKVVLSLEKISANVSSVALDVSDLTISTVRSGAQDLAWTVEEAGDLGDRLEIVLAETADKFVQVEISYSTSPSSSALQWLTAGQTSGGNRPFVYSQCQAINARALVPCQDTPSVKAPYSATIVAPANLTVLMSAVREGEAEVRGDKAVSRFVQKVPIPSYLLALAIGALESRQIGPRSAVWAERELIQEAALDFSQTESFLQTAEELSGPYVWGRFDILVLPPFFPWGGMENPCLTFVTPTLLSGDKSNSFVIAHEIAHSWTGNLVTNTNMEHFWLNEGFDVFLHRKIIGRLQGELSRHFEHELRWSQLEEDVNQNLGPHNPFTALVTNLTGVHPDEAFSSVPYEKGSAFLWYLEETLGGPEVFEPFLRSYIEHFAYKSIDTDDFKSYLLGYFNENSAVANIDWDTWLYSPGLPDKPKFNASLAVQSRDLAIQWQLWDLESPLTPSFQAEYLELTPFQQREFLATLIKSDPALPAATVAKLAALYGLNNSTNYYILVPFTRLGLAAKWEASVEKALEIVSSQGTYEFTRPLYKDLYSWEDKRQQAVDTFLLNREKYMEVVVNAVMQDLNIKK